MLIDDLLTLNQLEAATSTLDCEPLDLRATGTDAISVVHPLMQEKGQILEADLPEPLPVEGDSRRLAPMFVNLLANAHWHTPRGTRVWSTFVGYGATGGGNHAESAFGEDAVYVWSNNAYVYGKPPKEFPLTIAKLDLATGDYIWVKDKVHLAAIPAAGFLANDVYFVGSLDGTIKAYGAEDGKTLWRGQAPAAVASPLNVIGNTLFFGVGIPKAFGGTAKQNGMMAFSTGGQADLDQQEDGQADDAQQPGMPDTGAGGMANTGSNIPVMRLALAGAVLAVGAMRVIRSRSI